MSDGLVINETQKKAIILMIVCTLFTSLGQILWKLGLVEINFKMPLSIFNLPFMLGFVAYGVGTILMLLAFRRGELSILYPIAATSYVWVSLISPVLFPHDFMNVWKWSGVVVILISVSLLGYGSVKKTRPARVRVDG
ncbi:MAG: hypothetical protein KKH52_02120 [Nanoarchaeota archaeon]|nr:hypothetical protein [Nanoarchaeota archaeon]MBU1623092.1 hypothetical protein [Nanoarchaeota archaeon]MBU1974168.1 hypothetical protein [Nanoarchaeota archaeon]